MTALQKNKLNPDIDFKFTFFDKNLKIQLWKGSGKQIINNK